MYWANVAYLLMVSGSAALLLSCACARAGCCAQLFWRDRASSTASRPAQRLVTDIEAAAPPAGAQRRPPAPAATKSPVPQAVIDTFPTQFYRASDPPAPAAIHCSVDTTNAPDQHTTSGVGAPTATALLISSGGKTEEASKAQPLEPLLEGQGSGCSAGGGAVRGGQADAAAASGGAGLGRAADSTGGGTGLGTALKRMSRALSGGLPDTAISLCTVSKHSCAICLAEYEGGEELRRLPCLHSFHRPCIDAWMASNHTCPICRLDLTAQQEP